MWVKGSICWIFVQKCDYSMFDIKDIGSFVAMKTRYRERVQTRNGQLPNFACFVYLSHENLNKVMCSKRMQLKSTRWFENTKWTCAWIDSWIDWKYHKKQWTAHNRNSKQRSRRTPASYLILSMSTKLRGEQIFDGTSFVFYWAKTSLKHIM